MSPLLTPVELAVMLGVSGGMLDRWRAAGSGPPYLKLGGKTIRYRRTDVEEWLARQ